MSIFKRGISVQGEALVKRDESGKVTAFARPPKTPDIPKITNWRRQARDVTDNGLDMLRVLINIANGEPCKTKLPDGSETDYIVPTLELRRQAAKDVWEFIHGKAVAQTEVLHAEKEAEDTAQYAAFSDAQLMEAAKPFLERVEKEKAKLTEGESDE